MSLSDRIRPDVEAAPWVIEEVKKLEAQRDALIAAIATVRMLSDGWHRLTDEERETLSSAARQP